MSARRKMSVLARNPEPEPGFQAPPPRWEVVTNGDRVWCKFLADFGGLVSTGEPRVPRPDRRHHPAEAAAALREVQT